MPTLTQRPESPETIDDYHDIIERTSLQGAGKRAENIREDQHWLMDSFYAPFRGALGSLQGAWNLIDHVTGDDYLPDWENNPLGESRTKFARAVESISQFVVGFIPAFKGLQVAGRMGKAFGAAKYFQRRPRMLELTNAATAGAFSDFTVFDGNEARLANLIESVPALHNPITEFLAADPEDPELLGRWKNALEGIGLGAIADGLYLAIRGVSRGVKVKYNGGTHEETMRALTADFREKSIIDLALETNDPSDVLTILKEAGATTTVTFKPLGPGGLKIGGKEIPYQRPDEAAFDVVGAAADAAGKGAKEPKTTAELNQEWRETGGEPPGSSDLPKDPVPELRFKDYVADRLKAKRDGTSFNPDLQVGEEINLETLSTTPQMQQVIYQRAMILVEQHGKIESQSWFPTLRDMYLKEKEEIFNISHEEAVTLFNANLKAVKNASAIQFVAHDFMKQTLTVFGNAVKKAANSGSETDILKAIEMMQKADEAVVISLNYKRFGGQMLNSNKAYVKISGYETPATRAQMLEELGGLDYLKEQVYKMNLAAAPGGNNAGLVSLLRNQVSLGGKIFKVHNEFWINSILSGPKTFMVNMFGNTIAAMYLPFEAAAGAALMGNNNAFRSSLMRYTYMWDFIDDALKMTARSFREKKSILDPNRTIMDTWNPADKGSISSEMFGLDPDSPFGQLSNGLGNLIRLPTRVLMASDEFYKQLNGRSASKAHLYKQALDAGMRNTADIGKYVNERWQQMIRTSGQLYSEGAIVREAIEKADAEGLNGLQRNEFIKSYRDENYNPEHGVFGGASAAADYGREVAGEATFTTRTGPEATGLSGISRRVRQMSSKHPMVQLMVPFVTTPTNLLFFGGQRTAFLAPLFANNRLIQGVYQRHFADMNSGDALIQASARGRQAMGFALWVGAGALYAKGKITGGGPADEGQRKNLRATGWQPYSYKTDDGTYVSFRRLDPFATFFGLVADWSEINFRSEEHFSEPLKTFGSAIGISLARNIHNKSYLSGISQVIDAFGEPDRYMARWARMRAASYIPNLIAQSKVTLADDTYLREVRNVFDAWKGRLPGVSTSLEPRRNILGQPVDATIASVPLFSGASIPDWVSPIAISHEKNDPVMKEIAALQHGFSLPSTTLSGSVDMLEFRNKDNRSSYDHWLEGHGTVKIGGRNLHNALGRLIRSNSYKRLSYADTLEGFDSPRIQQIRSLIGRYRRAALKQTFKAYPDFYENYMVTKRTRDDLRRGQNPPSILEQLSTTY